MSIRQYSTILRLTHQPFAFVGVAFRGLFVIDDKGNLRQITINDLPVGRSVDETLRLIQAFQFTDKHGEVCPAGWKPGDSTMKPDPKGIQSYFQKNNWCCRCRLLEYSYYAINYIQTVTYKGVIPVLPFIAHTACVSLPLYVHRIKHRKC